MNLPETQFWIRFNGRFLGLLSWQDTDELWEVLSCSSHLWYVYDLSSSCPSMPESKSTFKAHLASIKEFLHQRQIRPHCGFVYVDDRRNPEFVKIFDPRNMGTSCGVSGARVFPRWTFSIVAPDALVHS